LSTKTASGVLSHNCVLLAAVEVKAKQALFLYIETWCNVCHVLLYFEFFIAWSGKVQVKSKKSRQDSS